MDSPRPTVDLERELTCSICTDLLYQPLTLLDCLHTFCGACLKEWFSWQATAAEHAPSPPAPDSPVYTCPSCRAAVRDTRHNATVATLLDMFLAANPEKAKPDDEKAEMNRKYKPGDVVLRRLSFLDKTDEERRLDEEERRLIEEVRQMSMREAVDGGRSSRRRASRSRDVSSDGGRDRARERARRHVAEEETRRRSEQAVGSGLRPDTDTSRRRTSGSRQRAAADGEMHAQQRRHVEHQSSLRSLISSGDNRDMSPRELEREIEEFARQIQEEGLLEGLDLDNIDLSNNDELSRKITEAYRRRQRQRSRHEPAGRSNASTSSHHSDPATPDNRSHRGVSSRTTSRQGGRSRSSSQTGRQDDRSRPPTSSGSTHLEVQEPRRRRRTTSGSRSATVPVVPSQPEPRAAARSQTDLSLRTPTTDVLPSRPLIANEGRSTSTPSMPTDASSSSTVHTLPFSARASAAAFVSEATGLGIQQPQPPPTRASRPADITVPTAPSATAAPISPGLSTPPLLSPSHHKRAPRSQLYPEPSLTCKRCQRPHIEYELHYNCATCHGGAYNICRDCYRRGRGCLHWFGFGYGAWARWEKVRAMNGGEDVAKPHMLTANRYARPRLVPGGAEGRVTLTNQNPAERLESGTFCARCERWTTREVYWRCEGCNEGDWGFCGECVGTGRCCSHVLLPLTYVEGGRGSPRVAGEGSGQQPPSPRVGGGRVSVQAGGEGAAIGPFRPVVVVGRCEVCKGDIRPEEERLHCYACVSGLGEGRSGRFEVCGGCYARLEREGQISPENGMKGWRRCLAGHRMAVVGFVEGKDGVWRRSVVKDWVGGRKLAFEQYDAPGLQVCYWLQDGKKMERLVTRDVAATADVDVGVVRTRWTDGFPPDGGSGGRAVAKWAWYPEDGAEDELLFPKGAEVREIEDVNGEWFHGVYMGAKGLFPAPYVVSLPADGV